MFRRVFKNISHSNIEIYKCTSAWLLFSIAILRWLELLIPKEIVFLALFPGIVFSLFLIYVLFKLKAFLQFKTYIFSIFLFATSYLIFTFLVKKYVSLIPGYEFSYHYFAVLIIILAETSLVYLLALLIKKIAMK
jgi:hypothetical protein